ncbi:hypothetical protein GALL_504660 [mine drainage metagenome]|uniref:Uncharacterized protein n=1 Tax=mine drainage metagenome TaxID=410659 RepID=A0A1J5P8N2_9ZZZZ
MLRNQVAGADIAVERHQFVEEAARPQHRIAATAVADGDRDQIAAIGRKGVDQVVDQLRRDHRHVAETDQRAIGIVRNRSYAGLHGAREPFGEIRVTDEFHI